MIDKSARAGSTHGFLAVDLTVGGKPVRFVNTHLENGYVDGFRGVIQSAQAAQILQSVASTPPERTLVIKVDHVPATVFADCPKLTAVHDAVRDHAGVQAWYA